MHRIHSEREAGVLVLSAHGELDAYAAPSLSQSLEDARIGRDGRFVADLSAVSFMDSTALGVLVRVVKDLTQRGGRVRVVLPNTTARRIFEITTLDRVLPVASTREAALAELAALDDMSARGPA